MSRCHRRWMRFARLFVACAALVLARPVSAASVAPDALDRVVLIASAAVREAHGSESEAATAKRAAASNSARKSRRANVSRHDEALAPLQSPRALIADKYLHHCALLR